MREKNRKYNIFFVILIAILLFPALLINIGILPLSADEATRATVALEMEYSGDLITPTINGIYYFNKPPFYNWILLSLYHLSGSHSEFLIRTPTVISLILFGLIIGFFVSKNTNKIIGLISALAFITCGRILFYDSFLGLIDITFSMLIFLNFMIIYDLLKKEKYGLLFFISWLLTAITFLMKGLPALVFQVITLVTAFTYFKQFRKLLSLTHFLPFLVYIFITGGYYYLLWQENPTMQYFGTLVSESTKRTFMEYGWWKTIQHLVTFPAEQIYHLAPWSVLLLLLFSRKSWKVIRQNNFITYLFLVFIFNIPIYWISYETYPRYLFMLYPLLLTVIVYVYYETGKEPGPIRKSTDIIFFVLLLLILPAGIFLFHRYTFQNTNHLIEVFISVLILVLLIIPLFLKMKPYRLFLLTLTLLVLRIGFDLVALPERAMVSRRVIQREQAIGAAKLAEGKQLTLSLNATCSHETTFYIEREHGTILKRHTGSYDPDALYLFDDPDPLKKGEEIVLRLETRWRNSPLRMSRIRENAGP